MIYFIGTLKNRSRDAAVETASSADLKACDNLVFSCAPLRSVDFVCIWMCELCCMLIVVTVAGFRGEVGGEGVG